MPINLAEVLLENRPKLSPSSIQTYKSTLSGLFKKHAEPGEEMTLAWFRDEDRLLAALADKAPKYRKSILAALVVLCVDCPKYKAQMSKDKETYETEIVSQKKTPKQEANWITTEEIATVFLALQRETHPLWSKTHLTMADLQRLQNYVILALCGGIYIPPRRSLDYCAFKIKDVDPKQDNHLVKNRMIFNKYKTAKNYGEQTVVVPPKLSFILRQWIRLNPSEWLLFDNTLAPLNNVQLTQRMNRIFGGRHISTSMIRHVYLSEKYKAIPALAEMKKVAEEMGHDVVQALEYIKKD